MKIYMVGGAVRDSLLGLPVYDRDWVAVGATPEQMLAAGYKPVGKDFPVFLHPQTHEEVALARTERKTARGYHGFAFHTEPTVTLEEDLARRDLTINAIAQDEQGNLIDPYNGQKDLQAKVLRHVTTAFSEDPVRILRVARLAARYEGFTVAPETMQLMQQMVSNGEVDALVAERVWQELSRGLMEKKPSRMINILHEYGALERILPEVNSFFGRQHPVPQSNTVQAMVDPGQHVLKALDLAAEDKEKSQKRGQLRVCFAILTYAITNQSELLKLCERLRVPTECKELAVLASQELLHVQQAQPMYMDATQAFELLRRCDAIRQPERFEALLQTAKIVALADTREAKTTCLQKEYLSEALNAALATDTAAVAEQAIVAGEKGVQIGQAVDAARLEQIKQVWAQFN